MQRVLPTELDRCSNIAGIYDVSDQLRQHVYSRSQQSFAVGDAARERIGSPEQLREHLRKLRHAFLDGCGGLPESDAPLHTVVTGRREHKHYAVETIVF
jgi:hypothetical protein